MLPARAPSAASRGGSRTESAAHARDPEPNRPIPRGVTTWRSSASARSRSTATSSRPMAGRARQHHRRLRRARPALNKLGWDTSPPAGRRRSVGIVNGLPHLDLDTRRTRPPTRLQRGHDRRRSALEVKGTAEHGAFTRHRWTAWSTSPRTAVRQLFRSISPPSRPARITPGEPAAPRRHRHAGNSASCGPAGLTAAEILTRTRSASPRGGRAVCDVCRERRHQADAFARSRIGPVEPGHEFGHRGRALDWGPACAALAGGARRPRRRSAHRAVGYASDRRGGGLRACRGIPTLGAPQIELFSGVMEGSLAHERRARVASAMTRFSSSRRVTTAELPSPKGSPQHPVCGSRGDAEAAPALAEQD